MGIIGRATRFRVFNRDRFTCRYCGRSAPTVELEVDHIQPKTRGGTGRMESLVTACFDCNRGKRDHLVLLPIGRQEKASKAGEMSRVPDINTRLLEAKNKAIEFGEWQEYQRLRTGLAYLFPEHCPACGEVTNSPDEPKAVILASGICSDCHTVARV